VWGICSLKWTHAAQWLMIDTQLQVSKEKNIASVNHMLWKNISITCYFAPFLLPFSSILVIKTENLFLNTKMVLVNDYQQPKRQEASP